MTIRRTIIAAGGAGSAAVQDAIDAAPRTLGARFAWLGDSHTNNGLPAAATIYASQRASYDPALVFAHPGQRSDQIAATTGDITSLDPPPSAVHILCGTNDAIQGRTLAQYRTSVQAMVTTFRTAGIPVVLAGPPPIQDTAYRPAVRAYNAWLRRWCADETIPFVDIYDALVGTDGAPATGMLIGDGVHYSGTGLAAAGAAFATTLSPVAALVAPPVASDVADETNLLGAIGLALTDTNADGIPDGWAASGSATGWTHSLVTDTAATGKWIRMVASGAGAPRVLTNEVEITDGYVPGDRIQIACRIRATGLAGATSELIVSAIVYNASWSQLDQFFMVPALAGNVTGVGATRFTMPANGAKILMFFSAGPGNGTYEIADATITNLTALGLT